MCNTHPDLTLTLLVGWNEVMKQKFQFYLRSHGLLENLFVCVVPCLCVLARVGVCVGGDGDWSPLQLY